MITHLVSQSVVLRPVDSQDAMSASAYALSAAFIAAVRTDVLSLRTPATGAQAVDMLFYDLTSKPPGTIEWE